MEKQKEAELNRLKSYLQKLVPEHHDKIDVVSIFDSSLSYTENKNRLREEIKCFLSDTGDLSSVKAQVDQQKAVKQKEIDDRIKQSTQEVEAYNKQLASKPGQTIQGYYSRIERGVTKLVQGYSNLLFVKGRGGIGKSRNIRQKLVELQSKYKEISGDVTEAYLYRLFYEHSDEVIWFKDVNKLLQGMSSLNLLKAACETEEARVLTKSNYSKEQSDLPDKFLFKGKIIFDYNSLNGLQFKEDFEALVSRGDFVELAISVKDVSEIMRQIAVSPEQKEVTEFVISNYEFTGMNLLNLRTQHKAFQTFEYATKNKLNWKTEIKEELQSAISPIRAMIYNLIGNTAVRTSELKKMLYKSNLVGTMRTADNKINEWLQIEELFKRSTEDRNFFIAINPKEA